MLLSARSGNSETWPLVVIRPIMLLSSSVNHNAPSGPTVRPTQRAANAQVELRNDAAGGDAPDLVGRLEEHEGTVWACDDAAQAGRS